MVERVMQMNSLFETNRIEMKKHHLDGVHLDQMVEMELNVDVTGVKINSVHTVVPREYLKKHDC